MDDPDEATRVRAVWSALGLPGVMDVHTHFMPDNVMAKVWGYFDRAGPLIGRPWPITYRGSEQERLGVLRAFGVLRFSSLVYAHRPGEEPRHQESEDREDNLSSVYAKLQVADPGRGPRGQAGLGTP